jgi:hypothetical protein
MFITFDESNNSLTVVDGQNQTIDLEAESVTITRAASGYRCDVVRAGHQARAAAVPAAPERALGVIQDEDALTLVHKTLSEIDSYFGKAAPAPDAGAEADDPPMDSKSVAKAVADVASYFLASTGAAPEEDVPSALGSARVAKDISAFFGVEQEGGE